MLFLYVFYSKTNKKNEQALINKGKLGISIWGAVWESNPRMVEPQSTVLTTSPTTPFKKDKYILPVIIFFCNPLIKICNRK